MFRKLFEIFDIGNINPIPTSFWSKIYKSETNTYLFKENKN